MAPFRALADYMRRHKRYWLLPLMTVLVLFAALVLMTQGSTLAPFLYALF